MSVAGGKHCSNSGSKDNPSLSEPHLPQSEAVSLLACSSAEHTSRSKAEQRTRGDGPKATKEAVK